MSIHSYGVAGGSPFWGDAVATSSLLPSIGSVVGELRLILDTQDIYEWNGSAWVVFFSPSSYVTSVTGSLPISSSGGATPDISISQSDTTTDGYLSSTDWNTFNGKQDALSPGSITESTSSVLTISNGTGATVGPNVTIEVDQADSTNDGYLSSSDWSTFNNKQDALTPGDITESTSSVLTITNGTGATVGPDVTIEVSQASTSTNGYLSSADWNTFNGKQPAGSYEVTTNKGAANGYCPLDAGSKVPAANLPSSLMDFKGAWNASTNSPTLADGVGDNGDVYRCSVAGDASSWMTDSGPKTFAIGDFIIYNGSVWQHSPAVDAVVSVNSKTGAVTLYTDDISEDGSPTNLWFTEGRVRSTPITGFVSGAGTVSASDTVLNSINKLDGNIILNNQKIIDAEFSGFVSFGGSGNYYSISGFQFNILRPGTGRIKGSEISWTGAENITLSSHKSYLVGYSATNTIVAFDYSTLINSNKEIQYENYRHVFTNNVILFSVWANAAGITMVVKNNHPYNYPTNISIHDHLRWGSVFLDTGAQISLLNAASRTIDSKGPDLIDDHGITTSVPDSTGVALSTVCLWQNASGNAQRLYRRTFTVSGVSTTPTPGATYTNNGSTFTVIFSTLAGGAGTIETWRSAGTTNPTTSGTLTKTSGTGDAAITYSSWDYNRVCPSAYSNAGVFTPLSAGGATRYGIVAIYALPNDLQTPSTATPLPTYFALLSNTAHKDTATAIASLGTGSSPIMTQFVMPIEVIALEPVLMGFVIVDGSSRSIANVTSGGFISGVKSYKSTPTTSVVSGAVSVANSVNVLNSTTNFDGWLSAADNDVQLALDTLDETGKDGTFKLRNTANPTKIAAFSCAPITAGNTRTITIPDRDLTLNDVRTTTTTNITGLLKGTGTNIAQAIAATDYLAPPIISSPSTGFTAANNYIYLVDCSGGAINIQLPTPAAGIRFKIKDAKGAANTYNITLVRAGTEKIDNIAASYVIDSNLNAIEVVSNGTDWFIL